VTAHVLRFHRDYVCRDAGACCRAGWTIPVEVPCYDGLSEALRAGALVVPFDAAPLVPFPTRSGDYAALLGVGNDGRCAFEDRGCAIQRSLGHGALPLSCQQFPRVAVMRPGSTAVSLSHYCPTAASLLFGSPQNIEVTPAPTGLTQGHVWEGLDLRAALPPLLRPDALFTWTTFDHWERFVLDMLRQNAVPLEESLGAIASGAEALRRWRADEGPLDTYAERCLAAAGVAGPCPSIPGAGPAAAEEALRLVVGAIPPDLCRSFTPAVTTPECGNATRTSEDDVVRRYLAARAWASWVAHESGGVRGYVRWLLVVLGTLRGCRTDSLFDALRHADLLLVHLASPAILARTLADKDHVPLTAAALVDVAAGRRRSRSAGRRWRVPVK
jgi:hypothetical protein